MLFGKLAPGGAIIKQSAAEPRLIEREGRAVVFSSLEDLARRIDEPDLDVTADDLLVLKTPARKAAIPCRKPGIFRSRASSPAGRQRHGAHFGWTHERHGFRHSGPARLPEAAIGGPFALVQTATASSFRCHSAASTFWLATTNSPNAAPPFAPSQRHRNAATPGFICIASCRLRTAAISIFCARRKAVALAFFCRVPAHAMLAMPWATTSIW